MKLKYIYMFLAALSLVGCSNGNDEESVIFQPELGGGGIYPALLEVSCYYYESKLQFTVDGSSWQVSSIVSADGEVMANAGSSGVCTWDWLTASRTEDGGLLIETSFNELFEELYLYLVLRQGDGECYIKINKGSNDKILADPETIPTGYFGPGGLMRFASEILNIEACGGTVMMWTLADQWSIGNELEEDLTIYDKGWMRYQKEGLYCLKITVDPNEAPMTRREVIATTTIISGADIAVYQKAAE